MAVAPVVVMVVMAVPMAVPPVVAVVRPLIVPIVVVMLMVPAVVPPAMTMTVTPVHLLHQSAVGNVGLEGRRCRRDRRRRGCWRREDSRGNKGCA
jgi:hypothetical protein